MDKPLWQKAASFAAQKHAGQLRKDGKTPYVAHAFRVAMTVRDIFKVEDPVALCAALLHDTIEDTTADYDDIMDEFGEDIAQVVTVLTKDKRMPESEREEAYDKRIAAGSRRAKLVKLADSYDNLCDSNTPELRKASLKRAVRTIELAGSEPDLAEAARVLTNLVEVVRQQDSGA